MDRKLVIVLLTLLAVAEIQANRRHHQSYKKKKEAKHGEEFFPIDDNLLLNPPDPRTIILILQSQCPGHVDSPEKESEEPHGGGLNKNKYRNKLRSKEVKEKNKNIFVLEKELLKDFRIMFTEVNTFVHGYAGENGQEAFNEFLVNTVTQIVLGVNNSHSNNDNYSNEYDYPDSWGRKKNRLPKNSDNANKAVLVVCDFLNALYNAAQECKNKNCTWQIDKLQNEESPSAPKERYGPDHDYLSQAVLFLAESLEANGDPKDDATILLAHAIHHLFQDIDILMEQQESVQNSITMINNINIILNAVENCANHPQCYDSFYHM